MLLLLWLPMIYGYSLCDVRTSCLKGTEYLDWWISLFSGCTAESSVVVPCNITTIPPFALQTFSSRSLQIPNCAATTTLWQSLVTTGDQVVDLSKCPLKCSCDTAWVNGHFHHLNVLPPKLFTCPHLSCGSSRLYRGNNSDPLLGESYVIEYVITGEVVAHFLNSSRQYFKWQGNRGPHKYREVIGLRSIRLEISNVTVDDLGVVRVVCWHCRQPLFDTLEIRVPSPVKAAYESVGSSLRMLVQGYPISRLRLTVTDIKGNNITQELEPPGSTQSTTFWNSLVVRPDPVHSLFHRRMFNVFAISCTNCENDMVYGEFLFTFCAVSPIRSQSLLSNSTTNEQCDSIRPKIYPADYDNSTFFAKTAAPKQMRLDIDPITVVVVLLILIVIICGLILFCYTKNNKIKSIDWRKWHWSLRSRFSRRTSRATEETMLRLEERVSLSSTDYTGQVIPCIKGGAVQIHEEIGKGAFGAVYCGSWEKTGHRSVAVKALVQADTEVEKEALLLSRLDHENIVRLYGLTRDGDRLLLVFEMMKLGDLKSYLKARAPQVSNYAQFPAALEMSELKSIVREIAKGLCYLVAQQIVHRDLAARNCLVNGESDQLVGNPKQRPPICVKISDFGMSRRLNYDSDYYKMQNSTLMPVRWLPPEAISNHRFSKYSDIWALGVTMWEVFSYGNVPFDTLTNTEVVSYAIAGMRPPKPRCCPDNVYELMEKCWTLDPEQRASAEDVLLDPSLADPVVGPL